MPGTTLVRGGPNGAVVAGGRNVANLSGKVLAQNANAKGIAVTAQGDVYFTSGHSVVRIDAAGKRTIAWQGDGLAEPSGLALSPDQAMLVVTDAQSRFSWSFQVGDGGALINGEPFYRLEMPESGWRSTAMAATFDSIGQVYFATAVGIQMCEANGRVAAILNSPSHDRVTDISFASDAKGDWLYAVAGGKLYRRAVKVKGVPAWAPAKLPRPPL